MWLLHTQQKLDSTGLNLLPSELDLDLKHFDKTMETLLTDLTSAIHSCMQKSQFTTKVLYWTEIW